MIRNNQYRQITCIVALSLLALSGCGFFFRGIETVAELTIESNSTTLLWGDTATIIFRVKNKSQSGIEISNYPGCLLETWWDYNDTDYKKTQKLINFGKPRSGGIDSSLYITLKPGEEFVDTCQKYIGCVPKEESVLKNVSESITVKVSTGFSCDDTAKIDIHGYFISSVIGNKDGHYATIGQLEAKPITITVIPEKIKKRDDMLGTHIILKDKNEISK